MSIKAYVGRMGSGKTYEVVSVVILGALARGRRVVSNIAGLQYEAMVDLLVAQGIDPAKIGQLVHVEHSAVMEPTFWRTDKDIEQGIDSFIQPGDLVALDEIWRFWEGFGARAMPDRVMNFYRMHRHFTHAESGVACDVALITQDVMDMSRKVRAVIEETYRMEKLTAIGSARRYRVDVFQGGKTTRKPLRQIQRTYEDKYFPLYKSHSQAQEGAAGPKEENIDGRGNILKGALFKIVLPIGLLVMIGALWVVWRFLHPAPARPAVAAQLPAAPSTPPKPQGPSESADWRVVGYFDGASGTGFLLSDGSRGRVLLDPPNYKITAFSAETFLPSGDAVTSWGGKGRTGLIPQAGMPR